MFGIAFLYSGAWVDQKCVCNNIDTAEKYADSLVEYSTDKPLDWVVYNIKTSQAASHPVHIVLEDDGWHIRELDSWSCLSGRVKKL